MTSCLKTSASLISASFRRSSSFGRSKRLLHRSQNALSSNKNIYKSPDHVDAITGQTLPEFLWSNLERWPDAPAFVRTRDMFELHEKIYQ